MPLVRPWGPSALIDRNVANSGWNASSFTLTMIPQRWGMIGNAHDGNAFFPGCQILLINTCPPDPASLAASDIIGPIEVRANYGSQGQALLSISTTANLANFNANYQYCIVLADYSSQPANVITSGSWQANAATFRLGSNAAYIYG